jgi:chitinase
MSGCALIDAIGGLGQAECTETLETEGCDDDGQGEPGSPVAVAGPDQAVARGLVATLDGSHSRPTGQVTYAWTLEAPIGSSTELADATSARPSFTADREGQYVATLVVTSQGASASDSVTITAFNNRPGVDAGADRMTYTGTAVSLQGSASDADGDPLTLQWSIVSSPPGSTVALEDPTTTTPVLIPDRDGRYQVQLVASDGGRESMPDVVEVTSYHPVTSLGYRVVDAEYSRTLDRLVTISESPDQLHIHDPVNPVSEIVLPLPARPIAVSVSPDGTHAAVGYDARVSHVRLNNGTLLATRSISTAVADVVLTDNGMAYAMPEEGQVSRMYCLDLTNGNETLNTGGLLNPGSRGKASPSAPAIYVANRGVSPDDIVKFDITSRTAALLYDSIYHGNYDMCGDLWMADDGDRIFTRCGNVFRARANPETDIMYDGSLDDGVLDDVIRIQHLDHSSVAGRVVTIPMAGKFQDPGLDTSVRFYNDDALAFLDNLQLTSFLADGAALPAHGRFLFFSADGAKLFVVVRADESAEIPGGDALAAYDL